MWTKSYFFPWTLSRLGIFFFLFYFFTKINVKFIYILTKPGKTADIWQRYHWFPRQMTSEKRAQKFHTDDASVPKSRLLLIGGIKFPTQYGQSEALPTSG